MCENIPFLTEDVLYKLFEFFSHDELANSIVPVCRLWSHVAKKRMRKLRVQRFTFEGLCPVEANEAGCYPPFYWRHEKWLKRWSEILLQQDPNALLPLPPLVMTDGIISNVSVEDGRITHDRMDLPDDPPHYSLCEHEHIYGNVAIVIYGWRCNNEFCISGGFHGKVAVHTTSTKVLLELSLTFTRNDNTFWTVQKQSIVYVGPNVSALVAHNVFSWPILFKFYDVPFDSFSLTSPPAATHISIRKLSSEQEWYWLGMAPRFGRDGQFDNIDCNSLLGTRHCAQDWRKIVTDKDVDSDVHLNLPPLVLTLSEILPFHSAILNDESNDKVAIVIYGYRWKNQFAIQGRFFTVKPHESVRCLNVKLKISLTFTKKDNTQWTVQKQNIVGVKREDRRFFTFYEFPFESLSSTSPPVVTKVSIKGVSEEQKWFWDGLAPRFSLDGKFDTIDCNLLHGIRDFVNEWKKIVECDRNITIGHNLCLPPLLLSSHILPFPSKNINEDIVVVVSLLRYTNEMRIRGRLHSEVAASVLAFNVQVEMCFTFTTQDNTQWTANKQTIVTVGHEWYPFFTLYDDKFAFLSSTSAPVAANISFRKILPEKEWFWNGLAPLISRDGVFKPVDCNSLCGARDCAQEWKKMVENALLKATLTLPPFIVTNDIVGTLAVCVMGTRYYSTLEFCPNFHPLMLEKVDSLEIIFKVNLQMMTNDNSTVTLHSEDKITLKKHAPGVSIHDIPWDDLSPSIPPIVTVCILQVNENAATNT